MTALLFARIGGLPIEEALASSGPALLVALGAVAAKLRARYHRSKETGAQDASPLP